MVMFTKDASDRCVETSAKNCRLQKVIRVSVTRCHGNKNLMAMRILSEE